MNPFLREKEKRSALKVQDEGKPSSEAQLLMMRLQHDKQRLSALESIEKKITLKKELYEAYLPWISGILEKNDGSDDVILQTVFIWLLDISEFAQAYPMANYLIEHQIALEGFNVSTAGFIARSLSNDIIKNEGDIDRKLIEQYERLIAGLDYPDALQAQWEKALGLVAQKNEDFSTALRHFNRALVLDENSGVKKLINKVEKAAAQ